MNDENSASFICKKDCDTFVIAGISVYRVTVTHSIVGVDETDSLVIDLSPGSIHCGATKIMSITLLTLQMCFGALQSCITEAVNCIIEHTSTVQ